MALYLAASPRFLSALLKNSSRCKTKYRYVSAKSSSVLVVAYPVINGTPNQTAILSQTTINGTPIKKIKAPIVIIDKNSSAKMNKGNEKRAHITIPRKNTEILL